MTQDTSSWTYVESTHVLRHDFTGYEVDLEACTTSAQVLDWILQVHGKPWCTPEALREFIRMLDALMGDIQSEMCPQGVEHMDGRNWIGALIIEE